MGGVEIVSPAKKTLTILVLASVLSVAVLAVLNQEDGDAPAVWQEPLAADQRIFPSFSRSAELYVVNASAATYSEQLALVSLQGIVNRESSKMYLD
ncbi:MAG: GxGYxYP domain-containing protein, partial [Thermoplasmata archaeon]